MTLGDLQKWVRAGHSPPPKSRIKKHSILSSFLLDVLAKNQGLRSKPIAESETAPSRGRGLTALRA